MARRVLFERAMCCPEGARCDACGEPATRHGVVSRDRWGCGSLLSALCSLCAGSWVARDRAAQSILERGWAAAPSPEIHRAPPPCTEAGAGQPPAKMAPIAVRLLRE